MRIAELAQRTGVSTPTLRYYEAEKLLQPADRTESGYRLYGEEAVGRLGFIQRAKALGLTLREIRQLVQEPSDSHTDVTRLRHAIAHKLADTRGRLAELDMLRQELEALQTRLSNGVDARGHLGDCECWLPTGKEVEQMATIVRESGECTCCGCTCPSNDACTCCGCPDPNC